MKLLNPGPVTLTSRVRSALAREDMCHREQEFADLTLDVIARINGVYGSKDHHAVLLSGSGTCAVEAMIQSLVPRSGKALVVGNGVYGERAAAMLDAQGKSFELLRSAWTDPMDVAGADERLSHGGVTHVIAVHHETTTGRLNDVAALGKVCKARGVPMLLDAVSSFAGEAIEFEEWNLEAAAATANKCVHGVPGICFVVAHKQCFERKTGASSVYLDLHKYKKEQEKGWSPFTQAVQPMFALQEALKELEDQGGWKKRHAHYKALTGVVMNGLKEMGVEIMLESPEVYSSILTSYKMPAGKSYDALHDHLKAKGFVIYAGQGMWAGKIFRIAVMGDVDDGDMKRLLGNIREVFA
jgi:2-aminoethylphosphonate-pyruvate transaminase